MPNSTSNRLCGPAINTFVVRADTLKLPVVIGMLANLG